MLHRSSGMLLSMRCCWLALAEELIGWTDAVNVKSQRLLRGMGSLPACESLLLPFALFP